jgi:hypothetical protein
MRTRVKRRQRQEVDRPRARVRARVRESALPTVVETALRSPGSPLEPATRASMEQMLGHRLDDVRIHTGPEAERAAAALEAEAFTSARDVVFGSERYRPDTREGRRLLAHELVHALQQGRGSNGGQALQVGGVALPSSDPLEREADVAANEVAAGGQLPPGFVSVGAPAAQNRIARQAKAAVGRQAAVEVPESPEAVEELSAQVERLLIFDPNDIFGRVARRLARLAPGTRRALVAKVGPKVGATAQSRLSAIVAELEPGTESALAPVEEPRDEPREEQQPSRPPEPESTEPEPAEVPERPVVAADVSLPWTEAAPPEPAEEPPAEVDVASRHTDERPAEAEAEPRAGAAETAAEPERPADLPETAPPAPTEAREPEEAAADAFPVGEAEVETLESLDEAQEEGEEQQSRGAEEPRADALAVPEAAVHEAAEQEEGAVATPAPATAGAVAEPAEEPLSEEAPESADTEPPAVDETPEPEETEDREDADSADEVVEEAPPADPEEDATPGELARSEVAAEPDADVRAPAVAGGGEAEPELEGGAVETEDAGAAGVLDTGVAEEAEADSEVPAGAIPDEGPGVPIDEPASPEVPDVSEQEPEQAMATATALPPAESQAALGGVSAATSRSVGAKRAELAANPPELDRPTGAPTEAERLAEERELPSVPGAPTRVERAPAGATPPPVEMAPLPAPPALATAAARTPIVPGGPQGEMTEDEARAISSSIRSLPTTDPDLELRGGPAPSIELEGTADPQRMREQHLRLAESTAAAQAEGRRDVARPMGENEVDPDVPPERLRAAIPQAPGATASAPGPAAAAAPAGRPAAGEGPASHRTVSIVAQQQHGETLRATAAQARADMAARRQEHETKVTDEHARAATEVAELVQSNAAQQTTERKAARLEVYRQRTGWVEGQREATERARTKADTASRTAEEDVERERSKGEAAAQTRIAEGDRDAEAAQRRGEEDARKEKERGERETESEGFFGWLAKKASDFFDAVKEGIKRAFDAARAAVREAIQKAKDLAVAAIELARDAIVTAIQKAGDLLIEIGDRLLADFPALRDRFRAAIKDRVERAVARVNRLADGLKEGVKKALDLLGAALDAALGLLEKGLLFVVDAYAQAVQDAIKAAQAVVRALGVFAVLIRDISADPLQWLSNLGKSAKDGVRNHLWKAFKREVKRWFNEKLEEVLGLGLTVWNLLKRGGISLAKIGAMVWEGLKQVIPITLIQILIEKLVAMIIPAAGAIMTIIEGLQAAWGSVQRLLQAFERFFTFLKAVRTGQAGPQFANAVAAAAIVVIDFVANWLLARLRKPAGKLAKAIRALATKIGKKIGKALRRLGKKLFKPRRGGRRKRKRPSPDKRAKAQRRVDKASDFLARQLARGMPYFVLRAQMLYAKGIYRVRIRLVDRASSGDLVVQANPTKKTPVEKKQPKKQPVDPTKYRERAEIHLGWMVNHHDVHHLLGKDRALRSWWSALDIDFNDPRLMLLLPPFLHQSGVHRGLRKLDPALSQAEQTKLVDRHEVEWNRAWQVWWAAKRVELGIQHSGQLRKRTDLHARVTAAVHGELRRLMSLYSSSPFVRANLNQFRLDRPDGAARFIGRYRKALEAYIKKLKRRKPPLTTGEVRRLVSDWARGRITRLRKAKARTKQFLYFLKGRARS